MESRPTSKIRQIVYGVLVNDNKNHFTVAVGTKQINSQYTISRIEEDENSFYALGYFEYNVYLSKDGKVDGDFLWKKYSERPSTIQYYTESEAWV